MIVFLTQLSLCTILGIDMGNNTLRVSISSKNQPVRLALFMNSKREAPNYFSIWNHKQPKLTVSLPNDDNFGNIEWAFGDTAKALCFRHPHSCVFGNHFNRENLLSSLQGYEVSALSLHEAIHSIIIGEQIDDTIKAVIAVPPTLSAQSKTLLYTSLKLAGIELLQFVDSTLCPVHLYALERFSKYANGTKNVAFVDIGGSSSSVTIIHFDGTNESLPKYTQLSATFAENCGGRNIDEALIAFIETENKKYINLSNPKTKMLLLNEVSKAKEMLTLHNETEIKFETVPGSDQIISVKITRDHLFKISGAFYETVKKLISDCIHDSKLTQTVDYVEVIGGCTRIPFAMELIRESFNVQKVSHSLNAESAVSIGAGYFAAMKSPDFIVKRVDGLSLIRAKVEIRADNKITPIFNINSIDYKNCTEPIEINSKEFSVIVNGEEYSKYSLPNKSYISFVHSDYMLPEPFIFGSGEKLNRINAGWELSLSDYEKSQEKINKLIKVLNDRRNVAKSVNDFEEYLFQLKNFVSTSKTISQTETKLISKLINDAEFWYEEKTERTGVEYEMKLAEIKNMSFQIIEKALEEEKKTKYLQKIKKSLKKAKVIAENSPEKEDFVKYVDSLEKWLKTNEKLAKSDEIKVRRKELKQYLVQMKKAK